GFSSLPGLASWMVRIIAVSLLAGGAFAQNAANAPGASNDPKAPKAAEATATKAPEATRADEASVAPKAPGELIDLGGYKFHLWCMGHGGPAVVMSSGAGDFSFAWALVQPKVAESTRACTYDRAGEAWSDLGPQPRTMHQEVFDLHRALAKAGVAGPYIMVGHSMGGNIVREFAAQFPADVAGIVLVDSGGEDTLAFIRGKLQKERELSKGQPIPAPRSSITPADALTPEYIAGMTKFIKDNDIRPEIDPPFAKLPPEMQKWQLWALGKLSHFAALDNSLAPEELQELYEARSKTQYPLGDLPLIVLRRNTYAYPKKYAEVLEKQHKELAEGLSHLSRQGELVVVPEVGHHIHLDAPQVVIDAISKVRAEVAAGR
ncbi:MAG TPA: alpha/beta hydrolase, partial [Candidatus Angelobacter sp.]|nr:alpha/beta hydrolase [Candidatus Angelobacter sp.]